MENVWKRNMQGRCVKIQCLYFIMSIDCSSINHQLSADFLKQSKFDNWYTTHSNVCFLFLRSLRPISFSFFVSPFYPKKKIKSKALAISKIALKQNRCSTLTSSQSIWHKRIVTSHVYFVTHVVFPENSIATYRNRF